MSDLLGSIGLAAIALGAVSIGAAIPWPAGVALLVVGAGLWAIFGR